MNNSTDWDKINVKKYVAYNSVFNFISSAPMYPLRLIKTRMQVDPQFTSVYSTFRYIAKYEGVNALWKGFTTFATGLVTTRVWLFATYEYFNNTIRSWVSHDRKDANLVWASAGAGLMAGLTSLIITIPTDVISQRLQAQGISKDNGKKTHYNNSFDACRKIIAQDGFRGFYRGSIATLCSHVPFSVIFFSVSDYSKAALSPLFSNANLQSNPNLEFLMRHSLSGFIAGACAVTLCQPMDVIKTQIQVETRNPNPRFSTVPAAAKYILTNYGASGFMRGWAPRVAVVPPLSGLFLLTNEFSKWCATYQ